MLLLLLIDWNVFRKWNFSTIILYGLCKICSSANALMFTIWSTSAIMIVYQTKLLKSIRHPSNRWRVYYPERTPKLQTFLPEWIKGRLVVLLVSFASTWQLTLIEIEVKQCGFALSFAENRKTKRYAQKCSKNEVQLFLTVFEFLGCSPKTVVLS